MLKIKDSVNLKELEMFGFKNTIKDTWVKEIDNSNGDYDTCILINPLNAEVKNQIVHYINNNYALGDIEEDDIDLISELDVLYDLIKADLVEKVGG